MKIAVIGAAGGVGQRVVAQARAAGHGVRALVRKEAQADALRAQGADVVLGDLLGEWTGVLDGTDAAVWAAGAGVAGNYRAIDGGALISLVDILSERGPRRLVAVSSMGVDRPEQMPPFLQEVLRVKAESDEYVQCSKLDWTIVRPGGLLDTPGTGRVELAKQVGGRSIPRDDVAAVVLACLEQPGSIHQTFEVVSGTQELGAALQGLEHASSADF